MYNERFGFTESPFTIMADPRNFFVNSCYEEAFATLRYGIEARKGFIVIAGEAGTGKTTLLKKLNESLGPNVHTACILDPRLSFAHLLRRIIKDLGLPVSDEDRPAMIGRIYEYLIHRLDHDEIVCLMFDEAQNLSDETLEELRLLSNLETHSEKLIQIVLMGTPEFEEKLDRPDFFHLKQRVVLRSRLRPLQGHEVGLYIDSRLKAVNCAHPALFDAESIKRIGVYSKGIPRLINIICDAALMVVYEASRERVTAEVIDKVARDLNFFAGSPDAPRASEGGFSGAVHEETFQPAAEKNVREPADRNPRSPHSAYFIPDEVVRPVFFDVPKGKRRWRGSIGPWIALSLVVAAGAVLYSQLTGRESGIIQSKTPPANPGPQILTDIGPDAPLPEPENPPPTMEAPKDESAPVPNKNQPNESLRSRKTVEIQPERDPENSGDNSGGRLINPDNSGGGPNTPPGRNLEIKIYKAIQDRAIRGVQVSVSDGTVYLDGRVATPKQKVAALRATLSVPGVKRVENGIVVGG